MRRPSPLSMTESSIGLAVTSAERIPYLPDMPTVAETLPGYEVTTWYGLVLPAGTPSRGSRQTAIGGDAGRRYGRRRESVLRNSGM